MDPGGKSILNLTNAHVRESLKYDSVKNEDFTDFMETGDFFPSP